MILPIQKYGTKCMGPDKEEILHGTHVAGIVVQARGNLGGDALLTMYKF
jgi:hypothetical protein